ncbi:MAG: hypothetical protein JSW40_05870 [Candidatus Omnitrophota bacterium]|nr:MAG: hypothetical protein JSW40_05870 [Candidatus Omnitrophota bacterium]
MPKRAYKKPDIRKVELVPQEAVLMGCKRSNGQGGKNNRCPPVSGGCKTTSGS